jgi:hypothetical protein
MILYASCLIIKNFKYDQTNCAKNSGGNPGN